jgi:hypothetical protein
MDPLGIPQFQEDDSFYFVLNGIVIQGGKTPQVTHPGNITITFPAAFRQQVLCLSVQPMSTSAHTYYVDPANQNLEEFKIHTAGGNAWYYWFAMGV